MKRIVVISSLILALLAFGGPSYSSTLSVSVDGLEALLPDTIWSYQINFQVIGGSANISDVVFDVTDQHVYQPVPNFFINNWNLNWSKPANGLELVILADEKDYGVNAPLVNGPLFEVIYDGVTLNLVLDSFLLSSDLMTVVDMQPSGTSFGEGTNQLVFISNSKCPHPLRYFTARRRFDWTGRFAAQKE